MRVYKFLSAQYAIESLVRKRLRISQLADFNDPFEYLCFQMESNEHRLIYEEIKKQLAEEHGILCFSTHWQNPIMWAHYADKHQGICLGFDIPDDKGIEAINYVDKPWPHSESPDEDTVKRLLYTKFRGWEYENEIRMHAEVKEKEGSNYFCEFGKNLQLREVILGVRCNYERSELEPFLTSYALPIKLMKAALSLNSFQIIEKV